MEVQRDEIGIQQAERKVAEGRKEIASQENHLRRLRHDGYQDKVAGAVGELKEMEANLKIAEIQLEETRAMYARGRPTGR